jgi:predicted AAA+ superfamily ATPase
MSQNDKTYLNRALEPKIQELARGYPVLVLTGPRQSGKTTLARKIFFDRPYVSLEDLDERSFAEDDPRGFIRRFPEGAIIDEVQRVPTLLSYLQGIVDREQKPGQFILTGSSQLPLAEVTSQSLAGRAAIIQLLPFSLLELKVREAGIHMTLEQQLLNGSYPRVHTTDVSPSDWYSDYIKTYIERDVRLIKAVHDLHLFQKFVKMCAGRCGQILNLESLGADCGISQSTARSWLSILETSFICFRLQPHFENFSKRMIKAPKLYFYDSGILCSLLGIHRAEDIIAHSMRGHIFESFVVAEFYKIFVNQHRTPPLYYWRDSKGVEVDLIVETSQALIPIEIKSGETFNRDFFKTLHIYLSFAKPRAKNPGVVFGGTGNFVREEVHVVGWAEATALI